MLPEWGRFVTTVKLNRGSRDSNYDQLYAYMKQHKAHANENKMMLDRFTQHTVDPLTLMSNVSHQQYYSQSSTTPPSTYGRQNRGQGNNARGAGATSYEGAHNRVGNPNLEYFKHKKLLMQAQENGVALDEEQLLFITDDCDAFDSDVDEAPTVETMFMANLSFTYPVYYEASLSYDSNILSEYVKDNVVSVVQSNVSSVPNDAYMMIINEMHEPSALNVSANKQHIVVNASLTAELAIYKELVVLYERRAKFELTEREQKIKEQLRIVITDHNIKEEHLKKELHSIKMQLTSTINNKKLMVEEVTSLKQDFKQKEKKYLEEFLDMQALKEKVEDKSYKQDQSLQTVHMLYKPESYYDEPNKVAIGYKNPLYLTSAQQVQPALYNGHEIIKTNHVSAIVHNSEDTLEISEITRKKINDKMKDPENNREVHLDYRKHLKESVATLREIIEEARVEKPLDISLESACLYTKHSQELVEYVIGTCPNDFNKGDKQIASTPVTRKKRVTFLDPCEISTNNTLTHVKQHTINKTNEPVIPSIRVKGATAASGSKPRSNTKKYRTMPAKIKDMMNSSLICLLSKASKNKSWLWHRRLNHLNFGTINNLVRKDLLRGLPRLKYEKDHICSACQLGKSKKHTHTPKTENTNLEVLNTLHMDLCGSVSKDETPEVVIKFLKQIQVSLNKTVRYICIDNEAVATACYTQNQSLIHTRHNKTSYELVHDKKPDLTFFRVFCVICYPTNDSEDLRKLKPTANIGFFVGYALSRKGYRIYNKRTRRIMETIHVQFDELSELMAPVQLTPYVPPTNKDLEILFQPMFDEYLELPRVERLIFPAPAVLVLVNSASTPSSTTIDQDASFPSH
nr:hypothetical protein [Tanacetum cinerariifolium]